MSGINFFLCKDWSFLVVPEANPLSLLIAGRHRTSVAWASPLGLVWLRPIPSGSAAFPWPKKPRVELARVNLPYRLAADEGRKLGPSASFPRASIPRLETRGTKSASHRKATTRRRWERWLRPRALSSGDRIERLPERITPTSPQADIPKPIPDRIGLKLQSVTILPPICTPP
jgi:hypothetical protein